MSVTLTVELPDEVKETIDQAASEEGISESAFTERALTDYLFLRRFRKLRTQMISESKKTYTDEEIFNLVS
jgi:predicted transcriptional regulator